MTAHKERFPHFQNIELFVPAVAALPGVPLPPHLVMAPLAERIWDPPPSGWPHTVFDALRELWLHSTVARAVMRNLVRRTTIYHAPAGTANTIPDYVEPYAGGNIDNLGAAWPRASDGHGWAAIIMVNSVNPPHRERGLLKSLRFTLMHELVHAANITNGAARPMVSNECTRSDAAPSAEESFAWMVENMYRYERRTLGRNQYLDDRAIPSGQMPNDRTTRLRLAPIETNHVRYAEARVPLLAKDLRALTHLPYNPFRDRASRNPFTPPPLRRRACV